MSEREKTKISIVGIFTSKRYNLDDQLEFDSSYYALMYSLASLFKTHFPQPFHQLNLTQDILE